MDDATTAISRKFDYDDPLTSALFDCRDRNYRLASELAAIRRDLQDAISGRKDAITNTTRRED